MEVESICGQQKPASSAREKDNNDDDCGGDSDDNSESQTTTICPLFMDGLPKNFATNPQLAAIASLLDDTVAEETAEDENNHIEQTTQPNKENEKSSVALPIPRYDQKHSHRTPNSSPARQWKLSTTRGTKSHRNRCRQRIRACPYPHPKDRKQTTTRPAKKETSVGEITLFMNLWKP